MEEKRPVIAVVGPTASGKTALGVMLARSLDGEIVSADSMQIYRELSVSTAKPTAQEMCGVPHHMIDVASVCESYSAARYCREASRAVDDIHARGHLPIIVGGTGLYVDSLISGLDFSAEDSDPALRAQLSAEYDALGGERLLERLRERDPIAAGGVHANNKKRLIRYLELFMLTGMTIEERAKRSAQTRSPYAALYLALCFRDRQLLYDRINRRVDRMIENGLVDEVRRYYATKNTATASQAIGCKELKPYIDGDASLDECAERLKTATRRYAKRQLTWFMHKENITPIYVDEGGAEERCLAAAKEFLRNGGLTP